MNIGSTYLKLKKILAYMILKGFRELNATYNISPETAELRYWMTFKELRQTHICGEQDIQI